MMSMLSPLVLGLEIEGAGLGDGAQVLFQIFLGHTDTVIGDGQGAGFLIGLDMAILQVIFRECRMLVVGQRS